MMYLVSVETKTGTFDVEVPSWGWDSYRQFLELDPGVLRFTVELLKTGEE